jgi:hypothetical protein
LNCIFKIPNNYLLLIPIPILSTISGWGFQVQPNNKLVSYDS